MKVPSAQLCTAFSRAALLCDGGTQSRDHGSSGRAHTWVPRAPPRAQQGLVPTPLVSPRALLLGALAQAAISCTFEGHDQISSGVNTQADPYSPFCELQCEGFSAQTAV